MKHHTTLLAGILLLGAICWVPGSASGQTGIPTLVGPINDGTPPPPPPPKPPKPLFDPGPVLETREFQTSEGTTASLHRVRSPRRGMMQRPEKVARPASGTLLSPAELAARRLLLAQNRRMKRQVYVSANVYDHRWTFLRWQEVGDRSRSFTAWSNIDFNHFTGIGGYDLSGVRFSFDMPVINRDTVRLKALFEAKGRQYVPPQPPELPEWEPAFVLVEGNPDDADGILPVKGLHDLYKIERFRLAAAFQGRERARTAREAWLKANPPQPKNPVLYHYPIQPEKIHPQRLQGVER